jgi:hypothetical protein
MSNLILPKIKPIRKPLPPAIQPYFYRWQTNSRKELGIVNFGFDLFPKTLNKEWGLADWVAPAFKQVLFFKKGMRKIDRAHAIATFRDGSKSTWFNKLLTLYFIYIGQYGIYWEDQIIPEGDYIRVRAKTQEKSEEKLTNIAKEFSNKDIIELFGDLQPDLKEVKREKLKSSTKMYILRNGYVVQAVGLNMPSRGANIFDRRPKVDINDDVEDKDNTKTETAREFNRKEILSEQFAGLADDGLTVYIGNYVHSDCALAHLLKPESGWKTQFHTLSYFDKDGIERSAWEKRFPISYIKKLEAWYKKQPGGWAKFRLEYYNEVISESDFKVIEFKGEYKRSNNRNWVKVYEKDYDGETKIKHVNSFVVVSGDPATMQGTSKGVVGVVAYGSDGKRRVIDLEVRHDFDINDRYKADTPIRPLLATKPEELRYIYRRGLIESMARKIIQYNADAFVLENAGQQIVWFTGLTDLLSRLGVKCQGMPYHPKEEKTLKLKLGLMPLFSVDLYEFKEDLTDLYHAKTEIRTFPSSTLDVLDMLFNSEQIGRVPPQIGLNPYWSPHHNTPNPEDYYRPPEDAESWMVF